MAPRFEIGAEVWDVWDSKVVISENLLPILDYLSAERWAIVELLGRRKDVVGTQVAQARQTQLRRPRTLDLEFRHWDYGIEKP